ncbi:olfactory receptor 14A16-like [Hemicordylus capensis]|uniref:olfactory receptor 14A16-like n=1 Tax=Hemicordylus capensis TaxID=884348 RepID=UPI002304A195|nr:olfactory receptor 14A16-like [Hemicordylus capensis]
MHNFTSVSTFLLLEISEARELQILHLFVFLATYLTTVSGNLLISIVIALDHHLHTPMYFFLINLAVMDLGSVSVIVPKSLANSLMNNWHISYSGCTAQVFFFVFFVESNFFLLTVMAYDRYVAICNPLQYEVVMNRGTCTQMLATVWFLGIFSAMLHTGGTFSTPFCSNAVNQFFCEIPKLLKLTCSDLTELGVIVLNVITGLSCFVFIVITYVYIFTEVLRIPSVQGRQKAFSTCLPHLIVFSTFVFTVCFAYLRPSSNTPPHLDLTFTVLYSMVPPVLNPIVYSMRNKDMKVALSKLFGSWFSPRNAFAIFLL